jgi:hypothetical protein
MLPQQQQAAALMQSAALQSMYPVAPPLPVHHPLLPAAAPPQQVRSPPPAYYASRAGSLVQLTSPDRTRFELCPEWCNVKRRSSDFDRLLNLTVESCIS